MAASSTSWPHMERASRFAVDVLAAGQDALCARFARSGGDKWRDGRVVTLEEPRPAPGGPLVFHGNGLRALSSEGDDD
ncbi:flavin reductase family protein [Streptomyces sp. NPDC001658]